MAVKLKIPSLLAFALPGLLTLAYMFKGYPALLLLAILFFFVLLGTLPVCRRRENLWAFTVSSVTCIPFVIRMVNLIRFRLFLIYPDFVTAMILIMIFVMIFSAVQIVLAVVVRFIWRKQYVTESLY